MAEGIDKTERIALDLFIEIMKLASPTDTAAALSLYKECYQTVYEAPREV